MCWKSYTERFTYLSFLTAEFVMLLPISFVSDMILERGWNEFTCAKRRWLRILTEINTELLRVFWGGLWREYIEHFTFCNLNRIKRHFRVSFFVLVFIYYPYFIHTLSMEYLPSILLKSFNHFWQLLTGFDEFWYFLIANDRLGVILWGFCSTFW